mmetsp:Transcript_21014/g.32935  ORF Transcript_21014/g.32935 Transcript_21014/m.32935 type:complete len:394 (+) Transcript_21014:219-1400(+)
MQATRAGALLILSITLILLVAGVSQLRDVHLKGNFELALRSARAEAQKLDSRDATKLCEKQQVIIAKIDTLMARLRKERTFLNATDEAHYDDFEDAFQLWLDTESVYQLSKKQYQASESAAKYTLYRLNVAKRVAALMSKNVEKVVKEYPVKKKGIDDERNMILELIELVKTLSANHLDVDVGSTRLNSIQAQVLAFKKDFRQQSALKQLAFVSNQLKSAQQKKALTQQEVEAVKQAILEVLMELLKDPDFRAFVLKTGMENILKEMKVDDQKVEDLEKKAIDRSEEADKAKSKMLSTETERKKKEGDKITKEEDYTDEHKQWMEKYPSVDRSLYILDTIRKKICTYCKTGKWALGFEATLECCEVYNHRTQCKATPTCKWHTSTGCQHNPKD